MPLVEMDKNCDIYENNFELKGADPVPEAPTRVGSGEGITEAKSYLRRNSAERRLRTQDLVTRRASTHQLHQACPSKKGQTQCHRLPHEWGLGKRITEAKSYPRRNSAERRLRTQDLVTRRASTHQLHQACPSKIKGSYCMHQELISFMYLQQGSS
jgi:hypothetical protein